VSRCPALHHALALVVALTAIGGIGGCTDKGAPEQVADAFAEAYFRQMDQEKAKEFTALGASAMLDAELRDVAQVRKEGYAPGESRAEVIVRRGEPVQRDQRIRFPFEVVVRADGAETVRDADVELANIQGSWKVVRVGLAARP
jgi:hypothetical protein